MIGSDAYFLLQSDYRESLLQKYGSGEEQRTVIQHAVEGAIKLLDALALRDILSLTKPRKILEVGSFLGFSLRWILESTKDHGSTVTSLDPRVRHRIFDDLKGHVQSFTRDFAGRVTLVDACMSERNEGMFLHDYLKYAPVWKPRDALAYLESIPVVTEPFDHFDFAFVDGDHSFNATVLNVALVARMMPNGGTIVAHDAISWPQVAPALEALASIGAINFLGVTGTTFEPWMKNHHGLTQVAGPIRGQLCDGLGIIQIAAGTAPIDMQAVRSLLQ